MCNAAVKTSLIYQNFTGRYGLPVAQPTAVAVLR